MNKAESRGAWIDGFSRTTGGMGKSCHQERIDSAPPREGVNGSTHEKPSHATLNRAYYILNSILHPRRGIESPSEKAEASK